MADLITNLPQQFLDEFEDEILGRIPEEKVKAQLRQEKIARVMQAAGSVKLSELGQKIAQIDSRLYFRMRQECAASPDDTDWIDDMLRDNAELCAPGYKPKASLFRHGKTFLDGKPV